MIRYILEIFVSNVYIVKTVATSSYSQLRGRGGGGGSHRNRDCKNKHELRFLL